MDREVLHGDRGVLEPIEEGAQRAGPSLARNLQRQGLVVPVPGNDTERRIERPRVREPHADVPAGDQTLPANKRFLVLSNFANAAVLDKETGLVWERLPMIGKEAL